MPTEIEWTKDPITGRKGETWNPVTGCTPVSEGCEHCYARRMFTRNLWKYDFTPQTLHVERLNQPHKWKKPRRIFVCSMGDIAHPEGADVENFSDVWSVMRNADWHTYILLTKRPNRLRELVMLQGDVLPHVWIGVSVENQRAADKRIPLLLDIPAAVRFVSCEPLLDWVDLDSWINYLDWVICGGETGPGARKMEREWAYLLRDQSIISHTPFFFKRWGTAYGQENTREMCGREWNQWPEGGKP